MGVPAFFRWLTRKYPSVVIECIEEQAYDKSGNEAAVDSSKKNPNGVEFDNFYLDMNGIIHPCTHPENKPAPKNEDEMMVAIFECIDRLFKIVRPRKLLYMAIDGVAPRAKMNQQRSRRFRSAKECKEKERQITAIRTELEAKGMRLPAEKEKSQFDSNCITPGTEFMSRLTESLNYYIHDRLTNDPGWKGLKVILSDASVPGEGEHKIMDFIRKQRALPSHKPNTHHCLCGADADLIMLGLATHEPHFTIIREEFVMNQPKRCEICAQTGHEMKECKGLSNPNEDFTEVNRLPPSQTKYIFVRLNVLREYLEEELSMPGLSFTYNFERAIDDWVFMCFFVGNDFLPHLPSLEIREGAIDRLVTLYKRTVYKTGGFITDSGDVNLERVQMVLTDLGAVEDEIFKKRRKNDFMFKMRNRDRKVQERMSNNAANNQNKTEEEIIAELEKEDAEPDDEVRLWEYGYKERYYQLKFSLQPDDWQSRFKIGLEYAKGLCWVLKYYYQGCVSWKWYFPFHYAPFASDIINITKESTTQFEKNTYPFTPLEQLMGVFPAASSCLVPTPWAELMVKVDSPILDFYPIDFMIDLNGKKFAWQGVALLPFVDELRLRKALEPVYQYLSEEEAFRNTRGNDRLYVGSDTDSYEFVSKLSKEITFQNPVEFKSSGVCGTVFVNEKNFFQGSIVHSPVPGLSVVHNNNVFCISFCDPTYPEGFKFLANRLEGAIDPPKTNFLNHGGSRDNRFRPVIGMAPLKEEAYLDVAGHRMLRHNLPREFAVPIGGGHRPDNERNDRGNDGNRRGNDNNRRGNDRRGGGWRMENRRTRDYKPYDPSNRIGGNSGRNEQYNSRNMDNRADQLRQYQHAAREERINTDFQYQQAGRFRNDPFPSTSQSNFGGAAGLGFSQQSAHTRFPNQSGRPSSYSQLPDHQNGFRRGQNEFRRWR